jgi:hypothetical protein
MFINLDQIPQAMKDERRWIHWHYEVTEGGATKVPWCPNYHCRLSATNPLHWTTFDYAVKYMTPETDLGFCLRWLDDTRNFGVVDLDDCTTEFGGPNEYAEQILSEVDSYAELSPSGEGIKAYVELIKPIKTTRSLKLELITTVFAAVTGYWLPDYSPNRVNERTREFEGLCRGIVSRGERVRTPRYDELIPDGIRDVSLFSIACSLRKDGREYEEIVEELIRINETRCKPPKPMSIVIAKAKQACKYPKGATNNSQRL